MRSSIAAGQKRFPEVVSPGPQLATSAAGGYVATMRCTVLAPLAAAALLFGCSSSSSSNPPTDAGTADAQAAAPLDRLADWSCLGKVTVPPPTVATAAVDVGLSDPYSNAPVKGANVKGCARTDRECASPFETATSGESGVAFLKQVPLGTAGFDGFFDVQVGSEIPNINFDGTTVVRKAAYARQYWGDAQLATLFSSAVVKRDPALGTIGIQAHDCKDVPNGVPCGGTEGCSSYYPGAVTFTIDVKDPRVVQGYIDSTGTLSQKAVVTSALIGTGGFLNVPPGPVTVTARVAATGQVVGTYSIFTRAGAISLLIAGPR